MNFRSMQVRPGCFVYVTLEGNLGEVIRQEWYITRGKSRPDEGVLSSRSRYGRAILGLVPTQFRELDGKDGFKRIRVDMVWQSPAVMMMWAESRMRDSDVENLHDLWDDDASA